jgi:hypothetical protein
MKVTYTEHAAPNKRGTTEHLQPALAASLIAAGFAVACPLPRRGSSEWLAARTEQAALARTPDKDDVCAGFVEGVEWGVKEGGQQVLIIKKHGHETQFFTEPPKDAPKSIVKQFEALVNDDSGRARAEQLQKARRDQANPQPAKRRWL